MRKTTIDESKDYVSNMNVLRLKLHKSLATFSQSAIDISNEKISISKNKEDTSNFIKDINDCYNIYLSLNAPKKFETFHELYGASMEHSINATVYFQQYIDTENINDMRDYLTKADSEVKISVEYINKAADSIII